MPFSEDSFSEQTASDQLKSNPSQLSVAPSAETDAIGKTQSPTSLGDFKVNRMFAGTAVIFSVVFFTWFLTSVMPGCNRQVEEWVNSRWNKIWLNQPDALESEQAVVKAVMVNNVVMFDDAEWRVLKAEDLGKSPASNSPFHKADTTYGRFIRVHCKVTNRTKQETTIFDAPVVVDSQGREFRAFSGSAFYVPKNANTLSRTRFPPDIAKEFYEVYEVADGATYLKLRVSAMSARGNTKLVDLGL